MGRRGLVGLFAHPRRQGSRDRIPVFPLIFQSPTTPYDASRPEQRRAERDVKMREQREKDEEPAGEPGMDTRNVSVSFEDDKMVNTE